MAWKKIPSSMMLWMITYKKTYFNTNNTAKIYIKRLIFFSFAFPQTRLITTYEITPMEIPSEMLYKNGIAIMAMKQGIASV